MPLAQQNTSSKTGPKNTLRSGPFGRTRILNVAEMGCSINCMSSMFRYKPLGIDEIRVVGFEDEAVSPPISLTLRHVKRPSGPSNSPEGMTKAFFPLARMIRAFDLLFPQAHRHTT